MRPTHVILYIDCDPESIGDGVSFIRSHAKAVIASTNAQAGLRVLATEPVSLVVLCDSLDAAIRINLVRQMKAVKPKIPIVLLAGVVPTNQELGDVFDAIVVRSSEAEFSQILSGLQ